jgi:3-deoxy-D-manno-octulosonic-acid transferase
MGLLGHSLAALGALALLPAALLALLVRPGWREGWRERLGERPAAAPGAVWVHGASVGEMRAAASLIERLRARGEAVTVSATTLPGRALMRRLRPDVPCALAPLDHPWCVARALRRVQPSLLVLVETELWPALIRGADARGVPVVIVSGRLSERSFSRYRRIGPLLRPLLRRLCAVAARSHADAERFVVLGVPAARVRVLGDLKLAAAAEPAPLAADLSAMLGTLPLVVAGSTAPTRARRPPPSARSPPRRPPACARRWCWRRVVRSASTRWCRTQPAPAGVCCAAPRPRLGRSARATCWCSTASAS